MLERKGKPSFERKAGRAGPVYWRIPILSKTTGARDKRKFFNGLIVQPVQMGEDQILNLEIAADRDPRGVFGSNLDVPRPIRRLGRAGVSMSFCPTVLRGFCVF